MDNPQHKPAETHEEIEDNWIYHSNSSDLANQCFPLVFPIPTRNSISFIAVIVNRYGDVRL